MIWSYRLLPTNIFGVALLMLRSSHSPWVWMRLRDVSVISHTSLSMPSSMLSTIREAGGNSVWRCSQASCPQVKFLPRWASSANFPLCSFKARHTGFLKSGLQDHNSCVCRLQHWFFFFQLKTRMTQICYGNIGYDSNVSQELLQSFLFSFSIS